MYFYARWWVHTYAGSVDVMNVNKQYDIGYPENAGDQKVGCCRANDIEDIEKLATIRVEGRDNRLWLI